MNRNGKPKTFEYAHPQLGGQVKKMSCETFSNYKFFVPYMEAKFFTAKILQQKFNTLVPIAVATDLFAFEEAKMSSIAEKGEENRDDILFQFSKKNTFTVVTHSVGVHSDRYPRRNRNRNRNTEIVTNHNSETATNNNSEAVTTNNGSETVNDRVCSLQNRICFQNKELGLILGPGRGGSHSKNSFTFAILGWAKE